MLSPKNETSTPVTPGEEKMVVLHPAQLIAFASDKLNPEKFDGIIHQWKKASLNHAQKKLRRTVHSLANALPILHLLESTST